MLGERRRRWANIKSAKYTQIYKYTHVHALLYPYVEKMLNLYNYGHVLLMQGNYMLLHMLLHADI